MNGVYVYHPPTTLLGKTAEWFGGLATLILGLLLMPVGLALFGGMALNSRGYMQGR